jgi:hypothetical protein
VLTLINFVAALMVSWIIVYAAYGLTLLVVHCVCWVVRSAVRLGKGVPKIWQSAAGSPAATSCAAADHGAKSTLAPQTRRPSFPDAAVSIEEASEALFEYERPVFWARSETLVAARAAAPTAPQKSHWAWQPVPGPMMTNDPPEGRGEGRH